MPRIAFAVVRAVIRRETVVGLLAIVLTAACGCAAHAPWSSAGRGDWQLMQAPEVADARYPRGYRIESSAPLAAWRAVGSFATRDECEQAMRTQIDDSIDRARAAVGDDAKNDLAVRRAVNARCVLAR